MLNKVAALPEELGEVGTLLADNGYFIEANVKACEAMAHRLKTPEGKKLYALRKQVPESVFGIIESVLGFRQFLLRGLDKVRAEWSLVTMSWNLKRMFVLCAAQ